MNTTTTRKRRRTLVKIICPTNLMHWKIKNEKPMSVLVLVDEGSSLK